MLMADNMEQSLFLWPLVLAACLCLVAAEGPTVKLPEFTAEGIELKLDADGAKAHAFLGLPYAQPPVGDLRYERPQALPASNVQIEAKELPQGCHPQEDFRPLGFNTTEDCLRLSVLTPAVPPSTQKPYPVLVWIHGGGFVYGMSRFYGYETLARHFVRRNIVLVMLQYRVGFLGFLSTGDAVLPGNLGLWDQTAGLRFVRSRIALFGGDPERVTVWGHSAGGASMHSLSLSPHSRSLFQQGIQHSGSLYEPWAGNSLQVPFTRQLLPLVGCAHDDSWAVKECLRHVPVETFWRVLKPYGQMRDSLSLMYWNPRMDSEFFDNKTIAKLTAEAPKKRILYGMTDGEGMIVSLRHDGPVTSVFADKHGYYESEQTSYTRQDFEQFLEKLIFSEERMTNVSNKQLLFDNFIEHYLKDENIKTRSDDRYYFRQYTELLSDVLFVASLYKQTREKNEAGWKQFMFLFDYIRDDHVPLLGVPACPHAYEFKYLADVVPYFTFDRSTIGHEEHETTENLVGAMAAFVHTGDPSHANIHFEAITDNLQPVYTRFGRGASGQPEHEFFTSRMRFWNHVIEDLGYKLFNFNDHVPPLDEQKQDDKPLKHEL